jgi:hypothetical protein
MSRFFKEITSKESWKKAIDLLAIKDASLSRPFKQKYDKITIFLATLIAIILVALLWVIFHPIINFIKMRASG